METKTSLNLRLLIEVIVIDSVKIRQLATETDRTSAFVVDRVKIFLTSSSITMQNLVCCFPYSVHVYRLSQNFENAEATSLGTGEWLIL